jgi:hypothetical protein
MPHALIVDDDVSFQIRLAEAIGSRALRRRLPDEAGGLHSSEDGALLKVSLKKLEGRPREKRSALATLRAERVELWERGSANERR